MIKERPILFSAPMVRALLAGSKTQTRRVVKRQKHPYGHWLSPDEVALEVRGGTGAIRSPYGCPGDKLWVRETWASGWTYGGDYPCVLYKATGDGYIGSEQYPVRDVISSKFGIHSGEADASASNTVRWRPSIHMPRWASRITLEVTDVRVERLRSITDEDALAEGIYPTNTGLYPGSPRAAFRSLWNSLNAKRGHDWYANPWVWVIEFKRMEAMG